jgi:hypothetical protein
VTFVNSSSKPDGAGYTITIVALCPRLGRENSDIAADNIHAPLVGNDIRDATMCSEASEQH